MAPHLPDPLAELAASATESSSSPALFLAFAGEYADHCRRAAADYRQEFRREFPADDATFYGRAPGPASASSVALNGGGGAAGECGRRNTAGQ